MKDHPKCSSFEETAREIENTKFKCIRRILMKVNMEIHFQYILYTYWEETI